MNQEQFDRLPRSEQLRLVAKAYGGAIPVEVEGEVKRRLARREANAPVLEDYEPADRIRLTLLGPPRTKKNSTTLGIRQSPAYRKYNADAKDQLAFVRKLKDIDYNLDAQFYVDTYGEKADLIGLLQALADTLQDAGIVTNDKQFRGFDGSRVHHGHESPPRTEISVRPLSETGETG